MVYISLRYSNLMQYDGLNVSVSLFLKSDSFR